MLRSAIKGIVDQINSGPNYRATQVVYVHNLSLSGASPTGELSELGKVKLVEKDGRKTHTEFDMTVNYTSKKNIVKERIIKLKFFDSIQLIPAFLRDLSNEFSTQVKKGYFPYKFVTESNLGFKGAVPPFEYFEGISVQEYNELLDQEWDLKEETLKYLEKDLRSLYEVIKTFAHQVFDEFNLNIFEWPTIPSLALAIFRGHYLKDDTFESAPADFIHKFVRESYYGGITEVFKPHLKEGYLYDVNSLYPAAMLNLMPLGRPVFTDEKDLNKIFGNYYVMIQAPEGLSVPILPTKDAHGNLICPVGEWSGWYFSEELKEARKFGYEFTIFKSYVFEKEYIFSEFVNKLYDIKSNSVGPRRYLAKLILNSSYGRFGLKEIADETILIKSNESEPIYSMFVIKEVLPLNNGYELIRYSKKPDLSKIQVPDALKEAAKLVTNFLCRLYTACQSFDFAASIRSCCIVNTRSLASFQSIMCQLLLHNLVLSKFAFIIAIGVRILLLVREGDMGVFDTRRLCVTGVILPGRPSCIAWELHFSYGSSHHAQVCHLSVKHLRVSPSHYRKAFAFWAIPYPLTLADSLLSHRLPPEGLASVRR